MMAARGGGVRTRGEGEGEGVCPIMAETTDYLALDLGAESGRGLLG